MGFPVPFAGWTRGGWNGVARDVLLDRRSRERGLIDAAGRRASAHAITPAGRTDGGDRIWSLLNLEFWHRHVHRPRRDSDAAPCASSG